MKHLLLIRHAKSSWAQAGLNDFDRPLNDRGLHDAPMMAERLLHRKVHIDRLVSSAALRALSTAQFFAKAYGRSKQDIVTMPDLYHASAATFASVVASLDNADDGVALFSHNPGITYYANSLGVAMIDNMPTCAVFGVHALTDSWAAFAEAEKRFWLFDYPKNF